MSADDLNIGRLVAERYRLDELLGRGGFGSVYQGWDTQIGRDVAVKLLDVANRARSAQQTAELRERFRREAMAAGRINHRGVVTIYDFGIPEDGGEAYLVMELLEGHDLAAELASSGPLRPDRVQKLFIPMLEALGRGHELGIVHKDIKPQNIFFCHPGTHSESFCLVDFGVARVVHEDKLTMTGLIVGTPQYMAPEYITDTLVTPALDVYQMALILVELITGTPAVPLGESFVKSCNRHFTGDLAVPEQLYEGEFGRMLKMALRPNPSERLPDASRFAQMFGEIDPSSIVLDGQATMVFSRAPASVPTLDAPPLFPTMRPDQVSEELERLERDSDAFRTAPDTPIAMRQPAPSSEVSRDGGLQPIPDPALAATMPGRLLRSAPEPPVAPTPGAAAPVPPPTSAPNAPAPVPPPPETRPQPAPPTGGSAAVAFISVGAVLIVLGVGLFFALRKPTQPPPVRHDVAQVRTPPALPPIDVERPAMTTITSQPSGAKIIIDGVEVGQTPGEVEIGRASTAELHLDGYEVALVKIEEDLETIALTPLPPADSASEVRVAPAQRAQAAKKPKVGSDTFAGRVFDPEEPDSIAVAEEGGKTAEEEKAAADEASPQKFESKTKTKQVEKWGKKIKIAE